MLKRRISNVGPFSSVLRHVYSTIATNNDYSLVLFMDNFLCKVDRIVVYKNVLKAKYVRKCLFCRKNFLNDAAHFSVHTFELYDETDSIAV